jgi:hypothetical protein
MSNHFSFKIIDNPHHFITFVRIISIKLGALIIDEDKFAIFK